MKFCELIWFDDGQAILQRDFHQLRLKYGEVIFSVHPDKPPIHIHKDNKLVAVVWPSSVPNRETAAAAVHELSLRQLPRSQRGLIKLVTNHMETALYNGGVENLWRGVARLLDAFERRHDASYTWVLRGITEWAQCRGIELIDVAHLFKGTQVPVSSLFYAFLRGQSLQDFLVANPTVGKNQAHSVLEHIIESIDL